MGPVEVELDVAAHEGGHVLVSWLLLLSPTRATIEPGLGFDGMVTFRKATSEMDREQAFDHAVVLMAGTQPRPCLVVWPVVAKTISPKPARSWTRFANRRLRSTICSTAARTMLKAHTGPLISIITALLAERTLDREQINKIMTRADDGGDDGGMTLAEFMAGGGEETSRVMSPRLVQYRLGSIL